MYLPSDMTFQYLFFDTYIGYFMQALSISIIVGVIYYFIKLKNDKNMSISKKIFTCLFVSYITGVICLTVELDLMGICWYKLIYHSDPGTSVSLFNGDFSFKLNLISNLDKEAIANIIMLFPFGILFPLSQKEFNFKNNIIKGIIFILSIEILQPIFGRAFDINDVVLNIFGVLISTIIYMFIRKILRK